MFIFYDWFSNEYTTEREIIAPPERYIMTFRVIVDDFFEETYVEKGSRPVKCCCIAYSAAERDAGIVEPKRQYFFEKYGFSNPRLRHWTIPADLFDKYVKKFDLKPFEDIDDFKTRTHIRERTAEND